MKMLDMSAGNRAVWFAPNHPDAMFLDIRPEVGPDIVCDTRALPEEVGDGFSLIVFDPPHKNTQGGNCGKNYGEWDMAHVRDTIAKSAAEAWRVSKPDALMAFKWNDHTLKIRTVLGFMSEHWEPLFGHGARHQQRHKTMTYWVMLRRRQEQSQTAQAPKQDRSPEDV